MAGALGGVLALLVLVAWPMCGLAAEELATEVADINLAAVQETRVGGSADARGEVYEGLEGNLVVEQDGRSVAHIEEGFAGVTGIVGINQSPGNNNNQGNVVSFAYIEADVTAALLSGGAAEVLNRDNALQATGTSRACLIEGEAFRDFGGLLQVNQSAGNLNNQNNILCMASGNEGVVALSEAALGQQVARNDVQETGVHKRDLISGAFNGVTGVVSINQSSGSGNNQTHMVVLSAQQFNL